MIFCSKNLIQYKNTMTTIHRATLILLTLTILTNLFVVISTKEDQTYWNQLGREELTRAINKQINENHAKNVILFVGDGMGLTTITTSRIYGKGEQGHLAWEKFQNVGVLKIYSANKLVPDSCSTATALFSGIKSNHKTSGVDSSVQVNDCYASLNKNAQVDSFLQWAQQAGKSTGFVTTTRITHATPSALYAHTPNRKWECEDFIPKENAAKCKDIAHQLVNEGGRNIEVIMGGGRQCLVANAQNSSADPLDTWSCISKENGRNLISDWINDKKRRKATYQVLENNHDLENMDQTAEFTLGVFANGHLKLEHERDKGPKGMPSLSMMTTAAIKLLKKNTNGYVLMVEGGNIDQTHHRGHARKALDETVAFSDAIDNALNLTDHKDTLIIVTSDHSHSMTFTGYPDREQGVLNFTRSAMDQKPYTNLLYTTGGPNNYQFSVSIFDSKIERFDPTKENISDFQYSQQALIYNDEVTHAGTDVLVYANGPMAHLFNSVHEQSYVAYVISYAAKIGILKDFQSSDAHQLATAIPLSVLPFGIYFLFKLI